MTAFFYNKETGKMLEIKNVSGILRGIDDWVVTVSGSPERYVLDIKTYIFQSIQHF